MLRFGILLAGLLLTTAPGCGPRIQVPADAGTLLTDPQQFPGTGEPYPLPELEVPSAESAETPGSGSLPAAGDAAGEEPELGPGSILPSEPQPTETQANPG